MSEASKTISGYVKTSNMYLVVMVSLAVGFVGGVIFSSYQRVECIDMKKSKLYLLPIWMLW